MLKLHSLIVEDFGPFRGEQTVRFSDDDGIVIVYGENGRGKTSLLNAIRYALFGRVLTRSAQAISLQKIQNWESAKHGKFGFKVILHFTHAGSRYELTRECRARMAVSVPVSDNDYVQNHYLRKDGIVLGPSQAEDEIARIMPERVSRFFLFDGELLQQYEELLRDESDMGRQIKESIERILGVPILVNARADLRQLLDDAQKKESKAAQSNQQTQELGNHHARLIEERSGHAAEQARLEGALEQKKSQKASLDEAIKQIERYRSLYKELSQSQAEVEEIDRKRVEREARLKELMADAWRGMLTRRIRAAREEVETELAENRTTESNRSTARQLIGQIRSGIDKGDCPTCRRPLDDASAKALRDLLTSLEDQSSETIGSSTRIEELTARATLLRSVEGTDRSEVVREVIQNIEDYRVQRHVKIDRINEIREQTRGLDESEHRRLHADYDRSVQDILILEQGIGKERDAVAKADEDIRRIQRKLDLVAGADLSRERRRREMCNGLFELFIEGVGVYREELRGKVERDATELFRLLTTEPEYQGLKINENYGLTIIHNDGESIPVRSAGVEHIVALSLMGALQKNAPMQGPIIMDSPFGRLDDGHTTKVLKALPRMASQVVLLIYESEVGRDLARSMLLGELKKEYEIIRRTARHSTLELASGG